MFKMIDLPYSYDALEPYIDAKTVEIHYSKHHQGYLNNLNKVLEGYEVFVGEKTIEEILSDVENIPEKIKDDVLFHGGGYANHNFYWSLLTPNGGGSPDGKLMDAIVRDFGSYENFKDQMVNVSTGVRGSGWGFLATNSDGKLSIVKTYNHGNPLSQGLTPLLTIDVWEHAYYLNYQNRRKEYVEKIFNILNWDRIEDLYNNSL